MLGVFVALEADSLTTSASSFARVMHSRIVLPGTLLAMFLRDYPSHSRLLPALPAIHRNRESNECLVEGSLLFYSPFRAHKNNLWWLLGLSRNFSENSKAPFFGSLVLVLGNEVHSEASGDGMKSGQFGECIRNAHNATIRRFGLAPSRTFQWKKEASRRGLHWKQKEGSRNVEEFSVSSITPHSISFHKSEIVAMNFISRVARSGMRSSLATLVGNACLR